MSMLEQSKFAPAALILAAMPVMALSPMASAQETAGADDTVPRMSAELPERLAGTNERAPEPVPRSSAGDIGEIDIARLQYGIGQPAISQMIDPIDIDVSPDGVGAPPGSGTYSEGEELYAEYCVACHGADLEGNSDLGAPRLIGGRDTLDTANPVKTVESYWPYASTLFDYTHRAMPMNAPGSLSADEVYAISAYILGRAGIVDKDFELNADGFAEIQMPNAYAFVEDPRPATP
jgi:cytochrome c